MTLLLGSKVCPFVDRIRYLIGYSKIQGIRVQNVDLQNKPKKLKDYSPYNVVPVLVFEDEKLPDGSGKTIWESAAIFQYLDEMYNGHNTPSILRGTPYEQAMQRVYTHYCNTRFAPALYEYLFLNKREKFDEYSKTLGGKYETGTLLCGRIEPQMMDFQFAPFLQRLEVLEEFRNDYKLENDAFLSEWKKRCDDWFKSYQTPVEDIKQVYKPYCEGTKVSDYPWPHY